jgi:hypothetical protein
VEAALEVVVEEVESFLSALLVPLLFPLPDPDPLPLELELELLELSWLLFPLP